jgi:hypothetical protein
MALICIHPKRAGSMKDYGLPISTHTTFPPSFG